MDLLKQEKGSITLFVVISMLFFVMFLTGMYMLSATAESGVIEEQARIKEIYEQGVNNIDEVYATLDNDSRKYLKDVASVGDYVAYDPTAGVTDKKLLSYTSPVGTGMEHGNGCSKTDEGVDLSKGQTFTANSDIKWRVLSINKETGEVVLISEEPIKTDAGRNFYMRGAIGYLYAEQELNEICKIYGYGKGANTAREVEYETGYIEEEKETEIIKGSGARSIDIDDINNITGYKPIEGTSFTHKIFYPTKTTENGKSLATKLTTDENADTYKGTDYLIDNTSAIYRMLFMNETNSNYSKYWISSRCTFDSSSTGVNFFVHMVYDGMVAMNIVLASWPNEYVEIANSEGVRPIVYLKTNIQTTGQDENGAWIIEE